MFARTENSQVGRWIPPEVDIYETGAAYQLVVDMPGVAREGLRIELDGSELKIRGERGAVSGTPLAGGHVADRFERSFTVPDGVDAEGITAALSDGVLTVQLAKPTTQVPRTIEVRAG